ncbi:predicted protein [Plenodomus lingam JN3]|uniref:Predicted protein n=1 Tax=Leptosphaeria maculans (strain JN3 / isolate v23.1.3 / race Av1-4-5-6-7-8) TaxID=985895 RepID=E4ZSR3_LEPMJ|nr:predicted protein [Plenodomus lingam JN3]CBX94443.1 predicted protein [Plenodomus lingam JN3]
MKLVWSMILAAVAVATANAIPGPAGTRGMARTFCDYKRRDKVGQRNCPDDRCGDTTMCLTACGRAGSNDSVKDFVLATDWDGALQASCSCRCYFVG